MQACVAGQRDVGFLINRHEPHQPHQTPDPLFVHQMIFIAQMSCHPLAVRVLPQAMSREADAL
ncbi:MAG: hypothetical protein ACI9EH_001455, partial [Planktomarina sp.]